MKPSQNVLDARNLAANVTAISQSNHRAGGFYSPNFSVHDTEDESRYFQVFSERTVHALSGYFEGTPSSHFWTRLVLQETHNLSAIRHAVIALGALTKSLENAPPPNLKVNMTQTVDQKHHEQAVLQHLKGIQALKQYISSSRSPQLRNTLITCLLFTCFEILQGSYVSCVQQIHGGLKMLKSYYGGNPTMLSPTLNPPAHQRRASARYVVLPQKIEDQLHNGGFEIESPIGAHIQEFLEDKSISQPEIGIQAPSPVLSSSFGFELSHPDHKNMLYGSSGAGPHVSHETLGYSLNDYLNALPSNMLNSNWGWLQSNEDLPSSRSTSVNSSPILGTNMSRSSSLSLPSAQTSSAGAQKQIFSRDPSPPLLLQNDLVLEDILVQAFVRLDGHGLFFGIAPSIPPLIWDVQHAHHLPIPNSFTNFHIAHRCWDHLMDRALQFYRRVLFSRNFAPETSDSRSDIDSQVLFWRHQLSSFESASRPFHDVATKFDGTVINPAALVISLYQKCTTVALAIVSEDSAMVYDSFQQEFIYIVRICRMLVTSRGLTHQLPQMPRFSLDAGIIPALHFTATKCRDPVVRREALDLLFSNPVQEGMWDAILSARVCRWVASWEEEGLSLPQHGPHMGAMPEIQGMPTNHFQYMDSSSDLRKQDQWGHENRTVEVFDSMNTIGLNQHLNTEQTGIYLGAQNQTSRAGSRAGQNNHWVVPEENRVRLTLVDYHIADWFIKVLNEKSLLNIDGTRDERKAIIAW
ncbi:hypothetical protein HYALB_00001092 [Hymenoscyphus albidus]|uniref:Uncharacterized protein n=1 Tax=Hymenoscyphus albidus TaxID=595503 RepID=A0A9N9M247_9HELO|nr:hypothetical protein HYALB_00001092 [Hymenoscyphus albidus]